MCLVKVCYITYSDIYQMIPVNSSLIMIYEDNVACVAQIRGWYIEEDKTKHISPKFFYTHEF